MNRSLNSLEVDESPLHVRVDQLYANPVAYVDTFEAMDQFPFDRRMKKTDPRAFGARTRDDAVEPVPDSWF